MKKLLAMVLAAAMMLSLCVFPVGAAESKVLAEWTWATKGDAGVTDVFTTSVKNAKSQVVIYNGTTYEKNCSAKMEDASYIDIKVPTGGGTLLVAYGESNPGTAKLKLTKGTETKSGTGTKSSVSGDTACVYEVELTAGTWRLERDGTEYWIAYMSLSPAGPSVSVDTDKVTLVKKDGGFSPAKAEVTVTVSNYTEPGQEFFAVTDDTKTVSVKSEPESSSDVNGTYTVTITPVEGAGAGTATVYVGVAESGSVTDAETAKTANAKEIKVTLMDATSALAYHLNLPTELGESEYTYYQEKVGKDDYILELWEIDAFKNDDNKTITGVDITTNTEGEGVTSYPNGYLNTSGSNANRYYFLGWSESPDPFKGGAVDYSKIKYPAVYLSGHTEDPKHPEREGYGVRGIYGYPSTFIYDPISGAQNPKFSIDTGLTDLYAIWVKGDTNAGLMGYTMQIKDGDFPGAKDNHTVGNMTTGTGSSQKLGINGMGDATTDNPWYKYSVLDGGYSTGNEFTVSNVVPVYSGTNTTFKDGYKIATTFVTWKLKNAQNGSDENHYLANPGDTVKYYGNYNVYSLDAAWATVTAPDKQIVGYNGEAQYPSRDGLMTKFNDNAIKDQDIFAKLFATDNRFVSEDRSENEFVSYEYEVEKDGKKAETTGSSDGVPGVTEPGVYTYTVTAHYKVDSTAEPVTGKTVGTAVDKDIGTVSFLFIVQPRLTVNVTKEVEDTSGSYKWPADGFEFSVTVTGGTGATVTDGTLTIKDSGDHTATTYVDFTNAAAGDYTITIHETTEAGPGITNAADQTVKVKATADSNGFITLSDAGGSVTAVADGETGNYKTEEAVTMKNTYGTGSLKIEKQVVGTPPASAEDGHTFEVTFKNWTPPASLTGDGIERVSGKTVNLKLKVGESATIENIPAGETYQVTETFSEGQEPSEVKRDCTGATVSAEPYSVEGTIENGETDSVTFTNIYTGDLKISKTVVSQVNTAGKSFTFTVTAPDGLIQDDDEFTVTGGTPTTVAFADGKTATVTVTMGSDGTGAATIKGLPAGTYTVTETVPENYTASPDSTEVNVPNGGSVIAAFKNTYDSGSLTITKKIEGGTDVKVGTSFTFTVTAPDDLIKDGASFKVSDGSAAVFTGGKATVTVAFSNEASKSVTIEGLPVGKYTVEEESAPDYTTTYGTGGSDPATATVEKDRTAEVTVTNTLEVGELKIEKTVAYADGIRETQKPKDPTFTFTVTFTNFPAGVTGFTVGYGGETATVTTGSNTVTFDVKMSGSGSATQTLTGIPVGTKYSVSESFGTDSETGLHYTTEWANQTGTIEASTGASVTCTNTYHLLETGTGGLRIIKKVEGGTTAKTFKFKITCAEMAGKTYGGVTFDGSGVAEVTIKPAENDTVFIGNIPVGATYKVEEIFDTAADKPSDVKVALTDTEADDTANPDGSVTGKINAQYNIDTITVTNRYLGNLTISKTVEGVTTSDEFTFHVTLPTGTYNYDGSKSGTISSGGTVTLKNGESITIKDLPAGESYTVTEDGNANYTASAIDDTGIIKNNDTVVAAFTNKRNTGTLTVTKELSGKLAVTEGKTFHFTVTLSGDGTSFNETLGDVKFENGVGEVTLNFSGSESSKSKTIEGLPVGVEYTVVEKEANDDGYITTYVNETGTIGTSKTVTVVNEKLDKGTITIKKVVEDAPAGDADRQFHFKIELFTDEDMKEPATDVNGGRGGFNFTDGVAEFDLKDGQSVTGAGEVTVTEGKLYYRITEEQVSNYTAQSESNDEASKTDGAVVTGEFSQASANTVVTFTNTYKEPTPPAPGPGTGGGTGTPKPPVEVDGRDHYAYIIGVPSGQVLPEGDITRAEIATIIFRLLKDEVRAQYWSKVNTFPDVAAAAWYNNAISTLQKMGAVEGEGDGLFHPEDPITRAETATMLVRLYKDLTLESGAASSFTDVDPDAWYAKYVAAAEELGLVIGDGSGVFRPDDSLTRAEAMTMFNRLLDRHPHKDHLLPDEQMILWPDNQNKNVWYYADVQEATNSHSCDINGAVVSGKTYEQWKEPLPVRDWAALERAWSDAYSGSDGHDVD